MEVNEPKDRISDIAGPILPAKATGKCDFSKFFDKKLRELVEQDGFDVSKKSDIALKLDLQPEVLKKIVNKINPQSIVTVFLLSVLRSG